MANLHGDFVWYELLTSDPDAAAKFYGAVIGWQVRDSGQSGTDYRLFSIDGFDIGGLMALPPGATAMGMRPAWLGYIGVDDVDASVAKIIAAGGALHMPATDIPGVGRFAMLADPQGAIFYVMRGSVDGTSTAFASEELGHCGWNELSASDPVAALEFYQAQFGWVKGDVMPIGEIGDYQFIQQGSVTIGAMMRRQSEASPPMWLFYFRVADIDAASERVRVAGGQILHGPSEVPGGQYVVLGADPQQALFALIGKRS